ncbi:MAG: histidinol dehydrogenase [Phycisphaerales bacterium]
MLIPSIDIQGGQTVQLVQGTRKALDAGDPAPIARRFGRVGDVAVIDLDAAMGRGSNAELVRGVLPLARCRVGGGIRDVAAARAWLDAGAKKVILGTAAREEVLRELPRERVIAALDTRDGEIVVEGWKKGTGRAVEDRMRELRGLVSGFLVTFVEVEGTMTGLPMARAKALREAAGDARLTVAGGVKSAAEVAELDGMGIDAQVGMALYTGAMDLTDPLAAMMQSDRPDGLWPTVVVDERGVALGLAYSNAQSLRAAVAEGRGVYWSRQRGLWHKGDTSGAVQELLRVDADCDRDTLRFVVRQRPATGAAPRDAAFCHTGSRTCWGGDWGLGSLERRVLGSAQPGSYTRRLLREPELLAAKLVEEAGELAAASTRDEVMHEAADVLYFATVRMSAAGVMVGEVETELDRRALKVLRRGGDRKGPPAPDNAPGSSAGRTPLPPAGGPCRLLRVLSAAEAVSRWSGPVDSATLDAAKRIVDEVRARGETAVREHAERLGDVAAGGPLVLSRQDMRRALDTLESEQRKLLERAAERIGRFAAAQRACLSDLTLAAAGGRMGHRVMPVDRAGCYAPGGRFPLPSSVLMTAITARAAGVREVWVASPRPSHATLAAAAIAGADGFLAVGGAQAIAAFAYGAGDVPRCDVVVGPGNRWVTAAKKLVAGDVGIDMLAGPSEVLILADESSDPRLVAADLLAQAEHDEDASAMLISTSGTLVHGVEDALARQLADLDAGSASVIRRALTNGFAAVVESEEAMVALSDAIAPEHLEVMTRNPVALARRVRQYGGLFVGAGAAEVVGDYGLGPNHVLPTGGSARFTAGLSVFTFLAARTWIESEDRLDPSIYLDAAGLARLEGLEAHASAAEAR